jgi:hypothetical protein
LNATTGEFIWLYNIGGAVRSSPAISGGRVYVGSPNKKVYCLNASTGTLVWSFATGGGVSSSPAIAGGRVYVGSNDNNVYCLPMIYMLSITHPSDKAYNRVDHNASNHWQHGIHDLPQRHVERNGFMDQRHASHKEHRWAIDRLV